MFVNVLLKVLFEGLWVLLREERCILRECLVSERPFLFKESYIRLRVLIVVKR